MARAPPAPCAWPVSPYAITCVLRSSRPARDAPDHVAMASLGPTMPYSLNFRPPRSATATHHFDPSQDSQILLVRWTVHACMAPRASDRPTSKPGRPSRLFVFVLSSLHARLLKAFSFYVVSALCVLSRSAKAGHYVRSKALQGCSGFRISVSTRPTNASIRRRSEIARPVRGYVLDCPPPARPRHRCSPP